jgi:hypothetical protein
MSVFEMENAMISSHATSVDVIPDNFTLMPRKMINLKELEQQQRQSKKRLSSELSSSNAIISVPTAEAFEALNMIEMKVDKAKESIGCTVCEENHSATYSCADCGELMCENVAKFHLKFKVTKGHTILPINDYPIRNEMIQNKIKRNRIDSEILCKDHGKSLDFFDEDCKTLNCIDCCMTSHKGKILNETFLTCIFKKYFAK